jgi:hypothetical protein
MYAKIEGNSITHYPYGYGHLKRDNPNTSFPKDILSSSDGRSAYNLVEVSPVDRPESHTENISEGTPILVGDVWTQNWISTQKTSQELNDQIRRRRFAAYGKPEDQIEFITENGLEAWQAKVAEIKEEYPKV